MATRFEAKMIFLWNATALLLNCYLSLSVVFFIVHLFAPIFGGVLLHNAIIKYGSWIGMALTLKYIHKKIKNRIRMKLITWIFISIYFGICMFLWFPYPINYLFVFIIIVGNIFCYSAQEKWHKDTP